MIVLGMGHLGKLSRVISPLLGAYLTFASLNTPTAPGQLSLQELQIKYNTLLN
jgi:3-dehydroquinate dehydratase-1